MNLVRFAPHSDTLGAEENKDSLVHFTEPTKGPESLSSVAVLTPKMPNLNHFEDFPDVHWMYASEVYAFADQMVAWADERVQALTEALREALSVASSVSISRDRRIVRDGCVLYAQTEEWCKWAEGEVAPKLRAAIAEATRSHA